MIPNVFISSTIKDLHYLRDGVREVVEELSYHPVMSEHDEVGYITSTSAANSCYLSIKECQLVVIIIGRRYGNPTVEGISVTNKEYRTARDSGIPVITFVEKDVLGFKEIFQANTAGTSTVIYPGMDDPKRTFAFIDEIRASPSYNGIIQFTAVGDAKRALKLQIANFVGRKLTDSIGTVKGSIQEVLSELKTLRHEITKSDTADDSKRFLVTFKFLVEERNSAFRELLRRLKDDLDGVLPDLYAARSFENFLERIGIALKVLETEDEFKALSQTLSATKANHSSSSRLLYLDFGALGRSPTARHLIIPNKELFLNSVEKEACESAFEQLQRKLTEAGVPTT